MHIRIGTKVTPWYTVVDFYDKGPYAYVKVKCKCKRTTRDYPVGVLKKGGAIMCEKCFMSYRHALYAPLRKIKESVIKQFKKRK